jgi:hypothetical protein
MLVELQRPFRKAAPHPDVFLAMAVNQLKGSG